MKLYLKLLAFVILFFSVVIILCIAWTPLRIKYYIHNLRSEKTVDCIKSIENLLNMGKKGQAVLTENFPDGREAAIILINTWINPNLIITDTQILLSLPEKIPGNCTNVTGEKCTALHVAAKRGYTKLAEVLIARGAYLNLDADVYCSGLDNVSRGEYIYLIGTPLLLALRNGHEEIGKLLIKNDADLNEMDFEGKTPLDLAMEYGADEIASLLRARGAKTGSNLRPK